MFDIHIGDGFTQTKVRLSWTHSLQQQQQQHGGELCEWLKQDFSEEIIFSRSNNVTANATFCRWTDHDESWVTWEIVRLSDHE